MPTYEYLCKDCEHRYERFQRMSDAPEAVCPTCGGSVRRVIFPAGVIFKGSGFYVTDSRKTSEAAAPAASTESKPTAEKAESTSAPASTDGTASTSKESVTTAAA